MVVRIYRATNVVSGEVREGTGDELAVILDRSKTVVREAAVARGVICGVWSMVELGECEDFPDHVERLGLRKVCPGCGKEFVANRFHQEWCSTACVRSSYKKVHPEKFNKPKAESKPVEVVAEKGTLSAAEIDRRARADGTSYGKHVAVTEYPVKIVRKWV